MFSFKRIRIAALAVTTVIASVAFVAIPMLPASASQSLTAEGSSFAGPEVNAWAADTAVPPYSLSINYDSDSSGDGRYDFASGTENLGVSDIAYQSGEKSPSFPFIYIPVTAGGLAFMYHLNGYSGTLDLTSETACGIMTGLYTTWNSPALVANNPGLANITTPVTDVIRSDAAGTNYVLEQYCLDEQPAMWASFVNANAAQNSGSCVSPTAPCSTWPTFAGAVSEGSSSTAADVVAAGSNNGYITAVETSYAIQANLPVASVQNASGDFTQPTPINVDSALAYATPESNGTQQLDFNGSGPNVYNPSTYSYMLIPTSVGPNLTMAEGTEISEFANYALTIGQQPAPAGYGGLGLSLEEYGVDQIAAHVPGAVQLTSDETSHYASGDLTPAEVAAGNTTPTPISGTAPTAPVPSDPGTTAAASSSSTSSSSTTTTTTKVVATTTTAAKKTTTKPTTKSPVKKTTATTTATKKTTVTTIAKSAASPVKGTVTTTTLARTTTTTEPPPPGDPSGFAAVKTGTVASSGGVLNETASGTTVDVNAPSGAFKQSTTVIVSSASDPASVVVPDLSGMQTDVAEGVTFEQDGKKYSGELIKPVTVTINDTSIGSSDLLMVYDESSQTWVSAAKSGIVSHVEMRSGSVSFTITADPAVAVEEKAVVTGAAKAESSSSSADSSQSVSAAVSLSTPTSASSSSSGTSSSSLAFTGSNPVPLAIAALVIMAFAEFLRRRMNRARYGGAHQ